MPLLLATFCRLPSDELTALSTGLVKIASVVTGVVFDGIAPTLEFLGVVMVGADGIRT